jgi:signal peptidase II
MRDRIRSAVVTAAVVGIDQITKSIVVANIARGESVAVIDDVLVIDHVRNTGAAFGLFRGFGGVLALAALAGIVVFGVVVMRRPYRAAGLAAGFVAGGAIGNLCDRLFRGSVVDFVDFRYWPAFNAADAAISIGAILLLVFGLGERHAPDRSG